MFPASRVLRTVRNGRRPAWNDGRARRCGTILLISALVMILVFSFIAFSVDLGYIALVRGQLQNAADAAALAGAQALVDGTEEAERAAYQVADANKVAGEAVRLVTGSDFEVGRWEENTATFVPLPPTKLDLIDAVRVTCVRSTERETPVTLFFAPVLGIGSADVRSSAVARLARDNCGRIVGLDWVDIQNGKVDSYNSNLGPYETQTPAANGHVCSNGDILLRPNGAVNGDARPGYEHSVNRPDLVTGSTTPRRTKLQPSPVNPGDASERNDNSNIPDFAWDGNGGIRLSGNDVLPLLPGIYYLKGDLTITGQATLTTSGPTILYIEGDVNIGGNGLVNTTGIPADLEIYTMGDYALFAGNSALAAVIYGPSTSMEIGGNAELFGAILGKDLTLSGEPTAFHFDEALDPFSKYLYRAKLVQ